LLSEKGDDRTRTGEKPSAMKRSQNVKKKKHEDCGCASSRTEEEERGIEIKLRKGKQLFSYIEKTKTIQIILKKKTSANRGLDNWG